MIKAATIGGGSLPVCYERETRLGLSSKLLLQVWRINAKQTNYVRSVVGIGQYQCCSILNPGNTSGKDFRLSQTGRQQQQKHQSIF
jgi:hypothetical protein